MLKDVDYNKILSGMQNESDEILLAILIYDLFTICSNRLRLESP